MAPDVVESLVCAVECVVDISGKTLGDLGDDFAGRGVVDTKRVSGVTRLNKGQAGTRGSIQARGHE